VCRKNNRNINSWDFWIDRGGTFTDIIAYKNSGEFRVEKLLSYNPSQYDDPVLQGIRNIIGISKNDPIPKKKINTIKIGTTIATNALLERKGEPTVLAITKGFPDLLTIGNSNRPELFDLKIKRPDLLHQETIEIDERILSNGKIDKPLDEEKAYDDLKNAYQKGFRTIAIALIHSNRFPSHENKIIRLAKNIGYTHISASHKVSPIMKIVPRGDTTVADAYLSSALKKQIRKISSETKNSKLLFMQSNGGLIEEKFLRAKDTILSGPAGGVIGMINVASEAGIKKVIGFDMGGTSTDVSHYNGNLERTYDTVLSGIRLCTPMMKIHTIASGGGSKCYFDGLRLRVGPESAGANPGPAAYRLGGPLTITDCNILLGRITPEFFPKIFGREGNQSIDDLLVKNKFNKLYKETIKIINGIESREWLAENFIRIAVEKMSNAIRTITHDRGYDVKDYTLVCYGGASGQHICQIADNLGIKKILIHPNFSVLSAYGIGHSKIRFINTKTVSLTLNNPNLLKIKKLLSKISESVKKKLIRQKLSERNINIQESLSLHYKGSDTLISVNYGSLSNIYKSFEKKHLSLFGFIQNNKEIIVQAISSEAIEKDINNKIPIVVKKIIEKINSRNLKSTKIWIDGIWKKVPVYFLNNIQKEKEINGNSIIVDKQSTIFLDKKWTAKINNKGHLILFRSEKIKPYKNKKQTKLTSDSMQIEIFNNSFTTIAERMGTTLQSTAHSVNIKERLDFSCAVFDKKGNLVANAPHVPVHLGSMSESVRAIISKNYNGMINGDVYITNAPYNGGTHLPDITLVMPIYYERFKRPVFFVASRGHHADVGGLTPGSMPPNSKQIDEEGVIFDGNLILRKEKFFETEIIKTLKSGSYPVRNLKQNLSDLRAQIAACNKGRLELLEMADRFGIKVIMAYTKHLQKNAEESVRRAISKLRNGSFTARMDDGSVIAVKITINRKERSAKIDFSGTSEQRSNNFNSPKSVTYASVLYVFRSLIREDIPMNEGFLKPLELVIPRGSMLDPKPPAAVVAGNVETSQIICDALFGALRTMAASQGTMNNLTFGNKRYQYYETICGGTGAGNNFDGTDAIQSHMTNSRLTDIETLENIYPIVVENFNIRKESGGIGKFSGGSGVIRSILFLEKMIVSILSGRRSTAPFGLMGGQDGKKGKAKIRKMNGEELILSNVDKKIVQKGDVITISTPGGGGYGKATD